MKLPVENRHPFSTVEGSGLGGFQVVLEMGYTGGFLRFGQKKQSQRQVIITSNNTFKPEHFKSCYT
jgi:hypothetical protein